MILSPLSIVHVSYSPIFFFSHRLRTIVRPSNSIRAVFLPFDKSIFLICTRGKTCRIPQQYPLVRLIAGRN